MATVPWVIVYAGSAADTALLRDLLDATGVPARLGDEVMGTMAPYVIAGGTTAAVKVWSRRTGSTTPAARRGVRRA